MTTFRYTPVFNNNLTPSPPASLKPHPVSSSSIRSYSPILSSLQSKSQNRFSDTYTNNNKFNSYVTVSNNNNANYNYRNQDINDYSRLNNHNDFESSKFTQSSNYFEEQRYNEKKMVEEAQRNSSKITGGIKVYPTIPREHKQAALIRQNKSYKDTLENEYNFIDSEKTFSKQVIDMRFKFSSNFMHFY